MAGKGVACQNAEVRAEGTPLGLHVLPCPLGAPRWAGAGAPYPAEQSPRPGTASGARWHDTALPLARDNVVARFPARTGINHAWPIAWGTEDDRPSEGTAHDDFSSS